MAEVKANGITITYDSFGEDTNPALLLVMGLGGQMIAWDPDFCDMLASRGLYVIRFDNRDAGLTTYFDHEVVPDMQQLVIDLMMGKNPTVPYTLDDMAEDGIALLSRLGIAKAHLCGTSLGGMIVQAMAINHPTRVLSMTSMMSTTGNPELPKATPGAVAALTSERANNVDRAMQRAVDVAKVIGSTAYQLDENRLRLKAKQYFERAFYPEGIARQMAAAIAHGDRRSGLQKLDIPSLVIHGTDDPLIPVSGGIDTHKNISKSELLLIEGMGHDMPLGTWKQIVDAICHLATRSQ